MLVLLAVIGGFYCLWRYRHDGLFRSVIALELYEIRDYPTNRRLLLVGDSNISAMSCEHEFSGWHVLNLGIAGLQAKTLRNYIDRSALRGSQFDAAILWIGINDLRVDASAAHAVAADTMVILTALKSISRRLALVQQPLLPIIQNEEHHAFLNRGVVAMNAAIGDQMPKNLATIIVLFPDEKDGGAPTSFADGLHLGAHGYERVCKEAGRWLAANE